MAGRPKGTPKTGGRKKGTPNVVNRDIKEMVLTALNGVGGVDYLQTQALLNPPAFLGLVGKVLPKEVHIDLTARLSGMTLEEKEAEALRMAAELGLLK